MKTQRLDRWISSHTTKSRKEVKELIRSGMVQVDKETVYDAGLHVPQTAHVVVEGRHLPLQKYLYLMLNKPAGVVSATKDLKDQTVIDLLPEEYYRPDLFPAGRLDKDTEGFVILTNDGTFGHQITSPNYQVKKVYHATLDRELDFKSVAQKFSHGVNIGEGSLTLPAELKVLKEGKSPVAELTLYEGKFHQVKRMFWAVGAEVLHLKRVQIGKVTLDPTLEMGEVRHLTTKEKTDLLT